MDPGSKKLRATAKLIKFDRIKRYTTKCRFGEVAHFLDASQKVNHTIIEQWPYRLKLQPGDPGAQEEFDRLFSGGLSGTECYLEWRKNT